MQTLHKGCYCGLEMQDKIFILYTICYFYLEVIANTYSSIYITVSVSQYPK